MARTRRFRYVLALAFVLTFLVAAFFNRFSTAEGFAAFGQAKRVTLPLIFVLFAVALIWRGKGEPPVRIRLPSVWAALLWIVAVSTAVSLVVPTGSSSMGTAAQGLVLFVGMVLSAALGWSVTDWPEEERDRLLTLLLVAAVVGLVVGSGPFISLAAPAIFGAAFLAIRSPSRRGRMCLVAVVIAVLYARHLMQRAEVGPISVAVELELAACAAVFAVAVLPRAGRKPMLLVLAGGGLVALYRNLEHITYLFGEYMSFSDVTLAQRGYETFMTLEVLDASPLTWLVGAGPGAYLNLMLSPDASTLLYAGRDIAAVDDVHLLTSHLLLKLGIAGLVWFAVLLWHATRVAVAAFSVPRPEPFDVVLLMFVAGGIAVGLPAANNFIANPLPALFLGVLAARNRGVVPQELPDGGSMQGQPSRGDARYPAIRRAR